MILSLMAPSEPHIEPFAAGAAMALAGELDAYDAPGLRSSFQTLLKGEPAVIVLDLSAVTFLDSTVLGAIVGLLRRTRESGRELRVVLPETTARRIFEITNLEAALDIWPSREAALAVTV
jgi:anti-sigma B factor antagonist